MGGFLEGKVENRKLHGERGLYCPRRIASAQKIVVPTLHHSHGMKEIVMQCEGVRGRILQKSWKLENHV